MPHPSQSTWLLPPFWLTSPCFKESIFWVTHLPGLFYPWLPLVISLSPQLVPFHERLWPRWACSQRQFWSMHTWYTTGRRRPLACVRVDPANNHPFWRKYRSPRDHLDIATCFFPLWSRRSTGHRNWVSLHCKKNETSLLLTVLHGNIIQEKCAQFRKFTGDSEVTRLALCLRVKYRGGGQSGVVGRQSSTAL